MDKKTMKRKSIFAGILLAALASCGDYPIDENGLLITERTACYMSSFDLVGTDHQTVLVSRPTVENGLIDTVACTVNATAKFGTNLKKVKPYCSVTDDITVQPGMGNWVDLTEPLEYTLVSGNRKIKKTYTVTVTVQY